MQKSIKDILTGLFLLVAIFSDSVYLLTVTAMNTSYEAGRYQTYSIFLAILIFLYFILRSSRINANVMSKAVIACLAVVMLFFLTQFFYDHTSSNYQSYFNIMLARFVPGVLLGAAMTTDMRILHKIEKALPFFVIFVTFILARVVFSSTLGANLAITFNREGGLNYQNISYYSIYVFGLTLYIITYGSFSSFFRYSLLFVAFVQIVMAVMAGGRGAFVLGIVFIVYFGMKRFSLKKVLLYTVLGLVIFYILQRIMSQSLMMQAGFDRIWDFFSSSDAVEGDDRWIRYDLAFNAFKSSPVLGHGLGSIFYEVGMYSHNVVTDILCEGGIVLMVVYAAVIWKFYKKSRSLLKIDKKFEMAVIIFLSYFIMSFFSGYYLAHSAIWVIMAFMLGVNKKRLLKNSSN